MSTVPLSHVPLPSRRAVLTGVLVTAVVAGSMHAPSATAAALTVMKVAPVAALPGHGVTVTGTGFAAATGVVFAGTPASDDDAAAVSYRVLSDTVLVAQLPSAAVTGPVRVSTADAAVESLLPVTVLRAPVIDSSASASGKGNDVLEITGRNLGVKRKVTIAGKAAAVLAIPLPTDTALSVKVPAGLPGGPTTLTVAAEGGATSIPFYVAPEIKGLAPKAGTTAGGTTVTVLGSGLSGVDAVTFNGVPADKIIGVTDKEVVVRAPAGVAGVASVAVRTRSGNRTAEGSAPVGSYTYQPLPEVTAVSPAWQAVGTQTQQVTISGTNLTADTVVSVGAAAVPTTPGSAPGTLTFTAPAAAAAAVVPVTASNITPTATFKTIVPFGYVTAPTVAKLTPVAAPVGATVVLGGAGFVPGSNASFGGAPADCTVVSFVAMRCVVPAGSGTAPVTVTTPLGTGPAAPAPAVLFTYTTGPLVAPAGPVVKALLPAMGLPGSVVAIGGSNLHLVKGVRFPAAGGGTVAATDHFVVNPARIVVRVPVGAVSGPLQLVQSSGPAVSTGLVRYLAVSAPTLTSIDAIGDATHGVLGGDTVILRGSGLVAGAVRPTVTIGGLPAPVLVSPIPTTTTVAVKVPVSAGRRAPVVLTTPFGTSTAPLSLYYVPSVTGVKTIVLPGGQVGYMVAGTGFTGAAGVTSGEGRLSAVTFGGLAAAEVVVLSDKQLLAVPAPQSDLADGLVVRTQHQGWTGTSESITTPLDLPIPTLASLKPNHAVLGAAPVPVTLSGTNLKADSVVRFGTALATVTSAASDGRSMVVVPPTRTTPDVVSVTVTNTIHGEEHPAKLEDGFRYLPVPSVSSISPNSGQTGTTPGSVTITGRNLHLNSVVRFGDAPATVSSAAPDGSSMQVSPPLSNTSGAMAVTVTNIYEGESLTATVAGGYSYSLSRASITATSATTGPPGTTVTITGTSFVQVSAVQFGTTPVSFTVVNPTTIFATVPATPAGQSGTVAISVVNGTGTPSSEAFGWTWDTRASITGLTPTTGNAGSRITIKGGGFLGVVTQVRFGSVLGISPTVVDDNTITVTVPNTPPVGGIADISVGDGTTFSGEPVPSSANDWTWAPIAALASMSTKQAAAGTTVTVTGRHFTGTTSVTIGNTSVTSFTPGSDGRSLTFVVPPMPTSGNTKDRPVRITNGSGVVNTVDTAGADLFTWL